MKDWDDRGIDEKAWFLTYDVSFTYHLSYSWDVEYSMWAGRFNTPHTDYMLQSFVHTLALRYTRIQDRRGLHLSDRPSPQSLRGRELHQ